ncbi:MAG TPA: winged helix-turn-helix domain-containing protein [Lichenihabitans sp.]|jgi:hypothetical protein|nr:winged helix-turn-helix domain-containing protein [Lichenihabitans sp.]
MRPNADLTSLSRREARRIALRAQGLLRARPPRPLMHHLMAMIGRLGLVQIDSVNVLARAHYMPAFSRLGAYDAGLMDLAAWTGRRRLFEYWGHEASLLPVETQPLLRWRMAAAAEGSGTWGNLARFAAERPERVREVLAEINDRGPLAAADLGGARGTGPWWGWSDDKRALEVLFWRGQVGVSTRRGAFERVYDLPERILPAAVLSRPAPPKAEAQRGLVRIAAQALGIATGGDLAAYFRLPVTDARARVAELVEAGELRPVRVEGWPQQAYLAPGADLPRRAAAAALISPFDPLLWERPRTERLFGFRYRLEIYTPAHKREHGYYVLPFLLGDRLVARLDLKADRARSRLMVLGAHAEPGTQPRRIAEALWPELDRLAHWLGLGTILFEGRGDLVPMLAARGVAAGSSVTIPE